MPGVELPRKPSVPTVTRWLLSKLFKNSAVESIQSYSTAVKWSHTDVIWLAKAHMQSRC